MGGEGRWDNLVGYCERRGRRGDRSGGGCKGGGEGSTKTREGVRWGAGEGWIGSGG